MATIKEQYLQEFIAKLEKVKTELEYESLKNFYISKNGLVSSLMSKIKEISPSEKAIYGAEVNEFKETIISELNKLRDKLDLIAFNEKLEKEAVDISFPAKSFPLGSKHPITIINELVTSILLPLGYSVAEGPEVESDHYNFEMMNFPKDHPAREMQDSFYINEETLLRTHTSPVQARTMLKMNGKPLKIICPGKVYRRDDDDATHSHQFNQIEGLVIDKGITISDLKGTLDYLAKALFGPNKRIRMRSSFFPFTEPSVEVDVTCHICNGVGCPTCKGSGWLEILGAGMVHPNVLKMGGYDPNIYTGFAFGLGADRIALLKYGITDIRELFLNNIEVLSQFKRVK